MPSYPPPSTAAYLCNTPVTAVLEAQVLLGIAEGELDLEAGAVEAEETDRVQLGVAAVEEHAPGRLRVGPAGQDVDHPQPALSGLAVRRPGTRICLQTPPAPLLAALCYSV